jgi:hypothetical protein
MKTYLLIPLILFSCAFQVKSQITFAKTYDLDCYDQGYSVIQNTNGEFMLAGRSGECGGTLNTFFIKTDENGDTIWTKKYSDTGNTHSMIKTYNGYYILGGSKNMGANQIQMQLIKADSAGNIIWQKYYGGLGDTSDYAYDLKETADHGFIILGNRTIDLLNTMQIQMYKVDSAGNLVWSRVYGGNFGDDGTSITITSDNKYVICGTYAKFSTLTDTARIYLVKTDFNGNIIWSKTYGNSSGQYVGEEAQETSDGGFIITGYRNPTGSTLDQVYLIKTDSNGDTVWTKEFGGSSYDNHFSVKPTYDGAYISTGTSRSPQDYDLNLTKLNSLGDIIWNKYYDFGEDEIGFDVQNSDNGFLILGHKAVADYPFRDILFVKTDSEGIIDTISGIKENMKDFKIYPNPASTTLTLQTEHRLPNTDNRLQIYNTQGQLVYHSTFDIDLASGETTFDISSLPTGLYYLHLQSAEGVGVKKFEVIK